MLQLSFRAAGLSRPLGGAVSSSVCDVGKVRRNVTSYPHVPYRTMTRYAGGISSGEDLYGVLGVSPTASAEDLKQAYHKLARQHHPDANSAAQDKAHDRFVKINAAFAILGDEHQRQDYDRELFALRHRGAGIGGTTAGYKYTYTTHQSRKSMDEAYGFYTGDFTGDKSPYKMFSNTGVVILALVWMVGGVVVHFWRFAEAHDEVAQMVEERSKSAATALHLAQSRARENGHEVQLEMLKELSLTSRSSTTGSAGATVEH